MTKPRRATKKAPAKRKATRPVGRPEFEPTEEQRHQVATMSGYGIPYAKICAVILNKQGNPIDTKTLMKWFRRELDVGMVNADVPVAETLFQKCVGRPAEYDQAGNCIREEVKPDTTALIWWTKCRMGWKEVSKQRDDGAGDGGASVTVNILATLTDDQLDFLARLHDQIAIPAPDQSGTGSPEKGT